MWLAALSRAGGGSSSARAESRTKIFLVSIMHHPSLGSCLQGLEVHGNVIELKRGLGLVCSSGHNMLIKGAMSRKFFAWNESARSLNNQRSSQSPTPPDPVFHLAS